MRLIDADALCGFDYERRMTSEEALQILWDRCQHCKETEDAIRVLKKRPQGEWVEKLDYNRDTYYDCSVCGNSWTTIEGTPCDNGMNFCPNCGADMRGDKK